MSLSILGGNGKGLLHPSWVQNPQRVQQRHTEDPHSPRKPTARNQHVWVGSNRIREGKGGQGEKSKARRK